MSAKEHKTVKCIKCHETFEEQEAEILWDERGYGYSAKLARCPHCQGLNIVSIIQDYGLEVNRDSRFYSY